MLIKIYFNSTSKQAETKRKIFRFFLDSKGIEKITDFISKNLFIKNYF